MDSPASKRMRLSASRTSLSGRKSLTSASVSALPRATSGPHIQSSTRLTSTTQPTYDFITGETFDNDQQQTFQRSTSRPPSRTGSSIAPPLKRTTLRTSMLPKPNDLPAGTAASNQAHAEELLALRSKVNSLDYELKNIQSERGLLVLQHEKELREEQSRADADYAKFQAAETERLKAARAAEVALKNADESRGRNVNEKASLERKNRELQIKYESVVEEKEDVDGRFSDLQREYERFRLDEVEGKRSKLESTLNNIRAQLEASQNRSETTQKRLEEREGDIEKLEGQIMELKGQVGGGEELDVLKREMSEQITYVRRLEAQTREQNTELRKLRDERRSVNVVEEEKRALETEVLVLKDAEKRAGELEIQKEILEDEKRMWTSLLEREGHEGQENEFDSPEAVVRALINERVERAVVVDRLGSVEGELAGKDETIRGLESDKENLQHELEEAAKSTATPITPKEPESKANKRLERQLQLAIKESEYLRAQLKTFDVEETIMMENKNFDTQRSEQIKHLESLIDQYRDEIKTLHTELSRQESGTPAPTILEPRGTKRPADSENTEEDTKSQLGALLRKNKNLQSALSNLQILNKKLAIDLQSTKSQLKALRESRATRVLELRDNPTSNAEAIKLNTLRTLKSENESLMKALRGQDLAASGVKTVPLSSLDAVNLDLAAKEASIRDKEKSLLRQREIWTEKAAEFRDVIASVLGYRVIFMPNGKVKISSIFYQPPPPTQTSSDDGAEQDDDNDPDDYILFDGEKGTMKISGGNEGAFGTEVRQLVDFWVKERKEIPCFLAAMTLEFYEKFGGMGGGDDDDGGGGE